MKANDITYGKLNADLGIDYSQDIFLTLRRYRRSQGSQAAKGCVMGVLLYDNHPICYTQERVGYMIRKNDDITESLGHELDYTWSGQVASKYPKWWSYFYERFPLKNLIAKFKYFVPEIAVKGRAGLRFHPGSNYLWSEGCVICGSYSSKSTYTKFDAPDGIWASAQLWTLVIPTLAKAHDPAFKGVKGHVYMDIEESDLVWDPGTPPPEFFANIIEGGGNS